MLLLSQFTKCLNEGDYMYTYEFFLMNSSQDQNSSFISHWLVWIEETSLTETQAYISLYSGKEILLKLLLRFKIPYIKECPFCVIYLK